MAATPYLSDVWSATEFRDAELNRYAEPEIREDTRIGVQIMATLSLLVHIFVWLLITRTGASPEILYSLFVLATLSVHVLVSARFVNDIRALQGLGMVLLVVSALAIVFMAHRSGDLSIGMMAAIVMLFISVPLVPWALREAATVVVLTVVLLTSSIFSVPGRFNLEAFWLLQMLVLGSTVVVGVLVVRNTAVRKQDIRTQFELDNARKEMRLLSLKDHLTGAWNRRYLDAHFPEMARDCRDTGKTLHVAVLDLDDFKGINDKYGHQLADQVLAKLGATLIRNVGSNGCLVRLGGDEFLILYCSDDLEDVIKKTVDELHFEPSIKSIARESGISLSAGFASAGPDEEADHNRLYVQADKALYSMKRERKSIKPDVALDDTFNRTGRWQL